MSESKGGRPRKPSRMLRTELVQFRATQEEFDKIARGALKHGQAIGDYIMRCLGFRIEETS